MNKSLPTARLARIVERDLFGGLLGMLAAAVVARVLLLAFDVPEALLIALLLLGVFSGAFVTHYGSRSAETIVVSFRNWNTRLRRVALKVMLWMLALAAATGVLTVLTGSYDTLGRVAGTVIAIAIVAGVLWPLSLLADRKNSQSAGLLGMAVAVVVYLLVIPLIWDLDRTTDAILSTSFIIGLTAPFGMFFLSLKNTAASWIAARVGVGVYVAVLVSFLVAAWNPGSWFGSEPWWEMGWWCAAYGSLSFASLCGMRRLAIDWRWLGVAASFFSWVLSLIGAWGYDDANENLLLVTSGIAVFFAHTSLALLVPLKPGQTWLRIGTLTATATAAIGLDAGMIFAVDFDDILLSRVVPAATILASCGSLALILFARLNRAMAVDFSQVRIAEITQISLICPRCQTRRMAPLGTAACEHCGLAITTAIELPVEPDAP